MSAQLMWLNGERERMTSDGDELFRAVCVNPSDDTPRLVYADWLEENGQPERAEFIRLQCEYWVYCRTFPDMDAARTRASDLLREHGLRWEMELPVLRGVVWGSLFVRGFVDTAWLTGGPDVRDVPDALFAAAPLQVLTLNGFDSPLLDRVLRRPELARLASFRLHGGRLTQQDLHRLADAAEVYPTTTFDYPRPAVSRRRRFR